ncbi:hypothetical protein LTR85_009029 [Meristemomyces frigidus]|nr:hypothetical protein LTR85_009029 [Meristemomyces frigidus]
MANDSINRSAHSALASPHTTFSAARLPLVGQKAESPSFSAARLPLVGHQALCLPSPNVLVSPTSNTSPTGLPFKETALGKLPPELRNLIYDFAFLGSRIELRIYALNLDRISHITCNQVTLVRVPSGGACTATACSSFIAFSTTSRQLHEEASESFWKVAEVRFTLTRGNKGALLPTRIVALQQVRNLVVDCEEWRYKWIAGLFEAYSTRTERIRINIRPQDGDLIPSVHVPALEKPLSKVDRDALDYMRRRVGSIVERGYKGRGLDWDITLDVLSAVADLAALS